MKFSNFRIYHTLQYCQLSLLYDLVSGRKRANLLTKTKVITNLENEVKNDQSPKATWKSRKALHK